MTKMKYCLNRSPLQRILAAVAIIVGGSQISACSAIPAGGPSTKAVNQAASKSIDAGVPAQVIDVTNDISRRLSDQGRSHTFDSTLGDGVGYGSTVGFGDVLDVSVWEAPPAVLFGSAIGTRGLSEATASGRPAALPEQLVNKAGTINVPFVGAVQAVGRTPEVIARDIQRALAGKAHDPQVIVRIVRNAAADVTVVGEVTNSLRMPLTAKGERLLDALASAGGVKQPVGKMTIQITRGDRVEVMPLEAVIKDPRQNIRLQAEDVVTLLFQPFSFTVLGAAKSNQEIPFEGTGLTLSQALGRMGGLDDQRANPKGVFIFRLEDPKVFAGSASPVATTKDGKVPVIYRVDMRAPATLFVAQSFPIKDKDVVYVSNAPLADFSKFLQAVSQIVYPIAVIQTTNIF